MPTGASSLRLHLKLAAAVLAVAGSGLCATSAVVAIEHGRPWWSPQLALGGAAGMFGLSVLATLLVGDRLDRRAHRQLTLRAGKARRLASMSQAAQFLSLTGRRVPEEAARVLVGHDRPGVVEPLGWRVPRYERDPNLLVDWVESGEPMDLYALALLAAIRDADLRAHLSGAELLDPRLLAQRAVNIREAS